MKYIPDHKTGAELVSDAIINRENKIINLPPDNLTSRKTIDTNTCVLQSVKEIKMLTKYSVGWNSVAFSTTRYIP